MPPYPKSPSVRQRRNKSSTATELVPRIGTIEIPEPPQRYVIVKTKDHAGREIKTKTEADWHPLAIERWEQVWASEMVIEYLEADYGAILRLLYETNAYWERAEEGRSTVMANESLLRLEKQFGLTPMARRSLDWTAAQTDESRSRTAGMRKPPRAIDATVIELPPSTSEGAADVVDALYD